MVALCLMLWMIGCQAVPESSDTPDGTTATTTTTTAEQTEESTTTTTISKPTEESTTTAIADQPTMESTTASTTTPPSTSVSTTAPKTTVEALDSLSFKTGVLARVRRLDGYHKLFINESHKVNGSVLRSKTDLQNAGLNGIEPYNEKYSLDLSAYTDEYFEDKALVLLYVTMGSGSYELSVDRLTVKGDTMTVHSTATRPAIATADMAYWCVVLEVSQSDVASITKVITDVADVTLKGDYNK